MRMEQRGEMRMKYRLAEEKDRKEIFNLVQKTVKSVYPNYYPMEVVEFFCRLHGITAITEDIKNGNVSVLEIDGKIVGTGCFVDDHITRVYVLPEYQGKGYGTEIVKRMENEICQKYDRVHLDASLPAAGLYEKLGYRTVKHERFGVEHGVILAYEVMEKELWKMSVIIRQMDIKDYEAVYDLWIHTPGMGLNNVDDTKEGIEKYLKRNPTTCFVAEEEEKIVGVIMSGHDGRRGFIHHTTVHSKYRKQGVGKKLVEHAMDALDREGINKVALVAFERNETGNAFWEKIGFSQRDDLVYRNKNIHELVRMDT